MALSDKIFWCNPTESMLSLAAKLFSIVCEYVTAEKETKIRLRKKILVFMT
jgi:hypothetical protein